MVVRGWYREGRIVMGGAQGTFRVVKLFITKMVVTHHYNCVKTHRIYNTKSEP